MIEPKTTCMKYLYWIGVVVVLIGGLVASLYFGIQPRTLPKITTSYFQSEDEMAKAISQRLRQELFDYDILFLGAEPGRPEHFKMWLSFLAEQKKEAASAYPVLIVDPEYKASLSAEDSKLLSGAQEMSLKNSIADVAEVVKNARTQQRRVAFLAPNLYTSQMLQQSPTHRLKQEFQLRTASFSAVYFPFTEKEEGQLLFPCSTDEKDYLGTGKLGCAVTQKYRVIRRKLKPKLNFTGLMDLTGENDYLVFFRKN